MGDLAVESKVVPSTEDRWPGERTVQCVRGVVGACWVRVGCRRVRLGSALTLGSHGGGGLEIQVLISALSPVCRVTFTTSSYASVSSLERWERETCPPAGSFPL